MTYHSYIFLKSDPSFQDVSQKKQQEYKKEFLKVLSSNNNVVTETYATLGLKANTNILLWIQADSPDEIQVFLNNLMHTHVGRFLSISYTLFGMVRPSQYSRQAQDTGRKGAKYITIYPFTKTQDWYKLSFEKRKELMQGHITIGRKYPQIAQLLLYSYGVDDCEFIVSYETDNLLEFQTLVMDLRADQVREYTAKDTPIFTCIYKTPEEIFAFV